MKASGRGVLWFLGSCLAMTQAVISIVAGGTTSNSVVPFLGFALIALIAILGSLLWMFKRNAALLIAQSEDLVDLALISRLPGDLTLEAFVDIVRARSPKVLTEGEPGPVADGTTGDDRLEAKEGSIAEEGTEDETDQPDGDSIADGEAPEDQSTDDDPDELSKMLDEMEGQLR